MICWLRWIKNDDTFVPFILYEWIFFNIFVLSQCIVYWINFENIDIFTYQKVSHYTPFSLFLKSSKDFRVPLSMIFSLACIILNTELLFIKTQRALNKPSKCANVRYHKNRMFSLFAINSRSKLKKFSTLFLKHLPRKTRNDN